MNSSTFYKTKKYLISENTSQFDLPPGSPAPRPHSRTAQKVNPPSPPINSTSTLLSAVTNEGAGHSVTTIAPIATSLQQVPVVPFPLVSPAAATVPLPDIQVLKSLAGRHILNVDAFTKLQLHSIFNLAQAFRIAVHRDRPLDHILKVIVLIYIIVLRPFL